MTSRERLLKKRPRAVDIEGEPVFVRAMTMAEILKVEALSAGNDDAKKYEALTYIVAACVVEVDGSAVFSGADDAAIQDLPIDVLKRLVDEVNKASGVPSLGKIEGN